MPFDPSLPANGAPLQSAVMRNQLNGLADLIATIPVGPQGPPGPEGATGPQGPPFASAIVDSTETSLPGSQAAVTATFDGNDVHFTFSIPQGIPGEVSMTNLTDAISFTSANTNGVGTLDTPFADPDTEMLRQKLNELILALRR